MYYDILLYAMMVIAIIFINFIFTYSLKAFFLYALSACLSVSLGDLDRAILPLSNHYIIHNFSSLWKIL